MLVACLCLSSAVLSADATGRWTGSATMVQPDGQKKSEPMVLVLRQKGDVVEGSFGPDEKEQTPFNTGKADGNRVTLTMGELTMKLTIGGDHLKGDIVIANPDAPKGTIEAKRAVSNQ
jgi:hypothetical protein